MGKDNYHVIKFGTYPHLHLWKVLLPYKKILAVLWILQIKYIFYKHFTKYIWFWNILTVCDWNE